MIASARAARSAVILSLLCGLGSGSLAAPSYRETTPTGPRLAPQAEGGIVLPGGRRFLRAAAGMAPASSELDTDFVAELARHLSAPLVLDYADRLRRMIEELQDLDAFIDELETRHGPVVASLADPDGAAYRKAEELLDFLGFRVMSEGERIQLQRRVGDRDARVRLMMGFLGISVPLQSRLWAAGEPIELRIEDERVPLLFGVDAWNRQVFERALDADEVLDALLDDDAARRVLSGYSMLDRRTREWMFREVGLQPLHDSADVAAGFLRIAPYLRVDGEELLLPGRDRPAWQAILGAWRTPAELIRTLVTKDDGRPAALWRALALVPDARARYLLTLGDVDPQATAAWATELYRAIRMPDFGDAIRWPEDAAELFVSLRLADDGAAIEWPGGARAWRAAFADDDPLRQPAALDGLWQRFAAAPDRGRDADAALLRRILEDSEPDRDEPTAIRKYLAVSTAIRYQPIERVQRSIPLLVRNYRRFGRAYGFFVMPTPLPDGTAARLVHHLQQVDAIGREEARVDAIRQLQATLILFREILLNDLLTNDDREALIASFLDLPLVGTAQAARESITEGYGTALTEWWRTRLLPAAARGLAANGWPGDPEDLRRVLVTALVGRIGISPLQVDGIDYNFTPANLRGQRMYTHLLLQEQPSFENLFRLDEIAATLVDDAASSPDDRTAVQGDTAAPTAVSLADEIEAIVAELEARMPPNIGDVEVNEALPVTIARSQLFERAATLVAELRGPGATTTAARPFRRAVSVYLGDALVGIAYALHMGDPRSFTYQQGHIAWLHRLVIAELGGDGPEALFGAWAATSESWILDEGARMHNSLFGASDTLSRWNLEDRFASGGPRDPVAAEAWSAAFARIHLPSLTSEAQRVVVRRHALATAWIREAAAAVDPTQTPSFWATADRGRAAPQLLDALRPLLRPDELQRFEDAVDAGNADAALQTVTDGNRYLLLLSLDDEDREAPPAARWLIDQMVGMPAARRGDYLGLTAPDPVPYGEAGDELADAPLYNRLLDVRVRLAVLMEELGLPATLHARLLMEAMARVLSTMTPSNWESWRNVLDAIDREVTESALNQWVVDLAFNDELMPTDPAMVLDAGADASNRGAPAGRPSTLGLPVDPERYQAAFGADVDIVTVDVGVWDDDGNFVGDLGAEDFTITRDGVPVTPSFVRLEGSPESSVFLDDLPAGVAEQVTPVERNYVLVADLLTTSPQDWERILIDITEFVRAGINVTDRLALVTIDSRGVPAVTHDFTIDHERVAQTLEAQVGNAFAASDREDSFRDLSRILCDNSTCVDPGDACEPLGTTRFPQCVTGQADYEELKMQLAQAQLGRWALDAEIQAERVMSAMTLVGSMLELGDPYDRQKFVILLSSGFERQPANIHYTTLIEYANLSPSLNQLDVRRINNDLSAKIAELADTLRRCRCTVYSIGTLSQAAFSDVSAELGTTLPVVSRFTARSTLQGPLNALSRDTGGRPFFGSDLSIGFRDVLDDTRLRYVLGFPMRDPDAGPDAEPRWYPLEVRVARDDIDVRARPGFYWPRR